MKRIYYIGDFMFPDKNAAGTLVLGNASLLRELNYEVVLIGNEKNYSHRSFFDSKNEAYGFEYYTVPHSKNLNGLKKFPEYIKSILKELEDNKTKIEAIIFYSTPNFSMLMYFIGKWAKKNNIKLIANIADISAITHGKLHERLLKRIDFKIKHYIYEKKIKNLITVTDYISKRFDPASVKNKVKIPPLVINQKTIEYKSSSNSSSCMDFKKSFVYAGVPFPTDGRKVSTSSYKDRLDIIIELFSLVKAESENFILNIYGISKMEYLNVIPHHKEILDELNENIFFYGIQKKSIVEKKIMNSDFTINFRDINEMTSAGFSTKFVESLSLGVPAIMTNTSEIDTYLKENINGFLLKHNDLVENKKKLISIIEMSNEQLQTLKNNCLNDNPFYFKKFKDELSLFMRNL